MRRGKPDSNHADILCALRKVGAFPVDLRGVGAGVCDTAIMFKGATHWLEIKSGRAATVRKGATADRQRMFRDRAQECGVHIYVVTSPEEALSVIGALPKPSQGDGW